MDVMQFLEQFVDPALQKTIYKCTLCGKMSGKKANMQRHMTLVHTKPTQEVCQYCSKEFKHKYYLDRHVRARECLSKMLFR